MPGVSGVLLGVLYSLLLATTRLALGTLSLLKGAVYDPATILASQQIRSTPLLHN